MISAGDKALIENVIGGDPSARDELVDRFSNFVWAILVRDLRLPREVAEDLHNETFLRLLEDRCRRLCNWRGEGNFVNYLGPIVRNLARDHFRLPRETSSGSEGTGESSPEWEPSDGGQNPEALAEVVEKRRILQAKLHQLSDRDRELIRRRHFQDQSYREIAEGMGYEISSVGVLLARAERRLRMAVERHLEPRESSLEE